MSEASSTSDVIIVGAGLAGLSCARALRAAGVACRILEASDAPGGRMRTDQVDGFQLDRGFQVLLTGSPECRAQLDLPALELCDFRPGALLRIGKRFHRVADPLRSPTDALATLFAPIGSLGDKLRLLGFRSAVRRGSLDELWARTDVSALERLRRQGFSPRILDRFFRPLWGGALLDHELMASSRMLEFVFRQFADGAAALPRDGMSAVPAQLAQGLRIDFGQAVTAVQPQAVLLATGESLPASAVVVATDALSAAALVPEVTAPAPRGVTCLYYAAERDPVGEPVLLLNGNGEGEGPVNHVAVPSAVAASYAPPGAALCAASVLGVPEADDGALDRATRAQLSGWFGKHVAGWKLLAVYRLPYALPSQGPPALEPAQRPARVGDLFIAGDHRTNGSMDGALLAGRRAAQAVVARLREPPAMSVA